MEGRFNGGFLRYRIGGGGVIFVGDYTWRGLFSASEWSYKNQNSCYGVNFRAGIFDRVIRVRVIQVLPFQRILYMVGKCLGYLLLNFLVCSLGGKTVIAHFEIFLV